MKSPERISEPDDVVEPYGSEKIAAAIGKTPEEVAFIQKAVASLEEEYGIDEDSIGEKLLLFSHKLRQTFGSFANLKGKKILDLGCGSTVSPKAEFLIQELVAIRKQGGNVEKNPYYRELQTLVPPEVDIDFDTGAYSRLYEPWLDRLLVELGAEPVGIDVGHLEGEKFTHHNVDLGKKGALDFLPDHSFDGVHSKLLLCSPQMEVLGHAGAQKTIERELDAQTKRLLKPEGKVIDMFG
ncbi:MAG: hypothetical protein Q7R93_02005 [bacterium]|nr:hypothetical protein [bacterium]